MGHDPSEEYSHTRSRRAPQSKTIILLFKNFILLKYSWCTMLCSFLLYSKVIQLYIYIHSFSYSFPLWFITGYWIQFPVLYSRALLFIHALHNSLHLLTPNSQSIPLPPPSSLATTSLFSMSVSLFLFRGYVHLCRILDSTYKWYNMVFVFLFLIYFD